MNSFIFIFVVVVELIALFTDDCVALIKNEEGNYTQYSTSGDRPIGANVIQYLDGSDWNLIHHDKNINISGNVPGDVITDLTNAGIIADQLTDINWLDSKAIDLWNAKGWLYTKDIMLDIMLLESSKEIFLVFDSVKMGATLYLNGIQVGIFQSQFIRYKFAIKKYLHFDTMATSPLKLNIMIEFNDTKVDVENRYMACTGGWDWAAYTTTFINTTLNNSHTFSKGIVKSVYLAYVKEESLLIEYVTPKIVFQDEYPTEPLLNKKANFDISTLIYLHNISRATTGELVVIGNWQNGKRKQIIKVDPTLGSSQIVEANLTATNLPSSSLWWPNGYGKQQLFSLNISYFNSDTDNVPSISTIVPIAFRYAVLVTGNDTDKNFRRKALNGDGNGGQTMMIRLNGMPVVALGANVIPLDELEGRVTLEAYRSLVTSIKASHFTAVRIWGGGIYMPDFFYDELSKAGIMVLHDLMYTGSHMPTADMLNTAEIKHNVRKIMNQPCLVMWNGCNECGGGAGLIASFAMPVVANVDPTRAIWPASPAHHGWLSGVNTLTGYPNGKNLLLGGRPVNETHGPYIFGSTNYFKPVNGGSTLKTFTPQMLPAPGTFQCTPQWYAAGCSCKCKDIGPRYDGTFASEFGVVGASSFESMSSTLSPKYWGLHSNSTIWEQRNYPVDNFLISYFNYTPEDDAYGEFIFKKQLYLTMLAQGLFLKSDIEQRRGVNSYGLIVWQLSEVWPTGGWGVIEYGSNVTGQVIGGRWKAAMHFFHQSVYALVTAVICANRSIYIRNDLPIEFTGRITVKTIQLNQNEDIELYDANVSVAWGNILWIDEISSMLQTICVDGTCVIETKLFSFSSKNTIPVSSNIQSVVQLKKLQLNNNNKISYTILETTNRNNVTIQAKAGEGKAALWVAFTSNANGYFSPNWFALKANTVENITFIPFDGVVDSVVINELKNNLRVEHLGEYY